MSHEEHMRRAIALAMAESGARCILVSRKIEPLQAVVEKIAQKGGKADAVACNVGEMDQLKDEMIDVISRHVEIERGGARIEMTQDGRQQRLIADIPLRPVKRRRTG